MIKKIKIISGRVYVNMYHYTCEDSGILIIFKCHFAMPDHNLAFVGKAFVGWKASGKGSSVF